MTLNPPAAVTTLRVYRGLAERFKDSALVENLAAAIAIHIGVMPFPGFQRFWHLHLQAIPWDTARAAWGRTQTLPPQLP